MNAAAREIASRREYCSGEDYCHAGGLLSRLADLTTATPASPARYGVPPGPLRVLRRAGRSVKAASRSRA